MQYWGIAEIAEYYGVSRQVVSNWRNRYNDFPKPIVQLKLGPVFDAAVIPPWVERKFPKFSK